MSSRKQYRPWAPGQSYLLPPSPRDWLPEDHLAWFVMEVVSELDLGEIERAIHSKDPRGTRPFVPQMMVALLVYGYCVGVFSSRKLAQATYEDVAFRVIAAGSHPHFTTINSFRKQHLAALSGLFAQVLTLCSEAGLISLGHVALDGTRMQANASRHKAMSYERMEQAQADLERQIAEMLARAEAADAADDARLGAGVDDSPLPEDLRRREGRLEKIRAAKQRLEAEAKKARARALREQAARANEQADEARADEDVDKANKAERRAERRLDAAAALDPSGADDDIERPTGPDGFRLHEPRVTRDGRPHARAQMNFTDPDSRIMESGGAFVQGYNAQIAVDDAHQIIVAHGVTNLAPDNPALPVLLRQIADRCGTSPTITTADAGYWLSDAESIEREAETKLLISTRRRRRGELEEAPPPAEQDADGPRQRMQARLAEPEARATYRYRKAVVEPVFGQIKAARGLRQFLLRGLQNVAHEWSLVAMTHNLLKLWRAKRAALPA